MSLISTGTLFYQIPKRHDNDNSGEDTATYVLPVTHGEWFCEATLWMHWIHRGTMCALVDSELIALDSKFFRKVTIENVDVFRNSKVYAKEFLQCMEDALQRHGSVFDLPPETIYPEMYPQSDDDNRTIQRRRQHEEVQAAELYQ